MKCIVVTPEKTEIDREASFVVVPLYDGEYGIGRGHAPVVARIGAGELRITSAEEGNAAFFIEGGFLEVSGETVSILTDRILLPEQVTLEEAKSRLQKAKELPQSNSDLAAIKEKAMTGARGMLFAAQKWGKK